MKKRITAALCAVAVLCLAGCSPFKSVTSVFKIHGGEDSGVVYIDESYEYPDASEVTDPPSSLGSQSSSGSHSSSGQAAQPSRQTGNRYYASRIGSELAAPYSEIVRAVANRADGKIALSGVTSFADLVLCYTAVKNDYPEYFWLDGNFSWEHSGGRFYLHPGYNCTAEEVREKNAQLSAALAEFDAAASSATGDYEKELAALNWLLPRVTYDKAAAAAVSPDGYEQAYTAYGALVKHKNGAKGMTASAVCEGYARAFALLLDRVGVQNGLVSGKMNGIGHMWNIVKVGNHWYYVDPTSADTGDSMNYCFVNITDKDISATYVKDKDFQKTDISDIEYSGSFNYKLPGCGSREYNCLSLAGRSIPASGKGSAVIGKQVLAAHKKGETSCEFIFDENSAYRFSVETIADEINFPECVAPLLAEDPKADVCVSGVKGANGFKICWKR